MNPQIVFFDCDGVLVFGNPWVKLHREMNISYELDKKWFDEYYFGKISFDEWNEKIESHYRKERLTKETFEDLLNIKNFVLNDEAWNLINLLKKKNIPTAIISNGIDFYVEKVAQHFGIDFCVANASFVFDEKGLFQRIKVIGKDQLIKVRAIDRICKETKTDPKNSIYIGDSLNDIEAFRHTGRGVLYESVNGENIRDGWTALDREVIKAAWKRVNNLNDVIELI